MPTLLILPFSEGHSEDNRVLQPVEDVIHYCTPPVTFHLSCLVSVVFCSEKVTVNTVYHYQGNPGGEGERDPEQSWDSHCKHLTKKWDVFLLHVSGPMHMKCLVCSWDTGRFMLK